MRILREIHSLGFFRPTMAMLCFLFCCGLLAARPASAARALITDPVIEAQRHTLLGHVRSEATSGNDNGPVADTMKIEHIILQLQRPAEQELALESYLASLSDPNSANYRHWMSAAQFGQSFGPAAADVQKVAAWLQSYGFSVNAILPSGMAIDFSGSAETVRAAFHTEIHSLTVKGVGHVANMSEPSIPAALAPAVAGIVSLHDFLPRAKSRPRAAFTVTSSNSHSQLVAPGDLATIYSLSPLFAQGYSGQGQTIAVIEDSNLYDNGDWSRFRSAFGLSGYSGGTLTVVHPTATGGSGCTNPGVVTGDDLETTIDAEWASAAAPSATIMVASCATTRATFGGFIALQNLLNSAAPPSIVSISYGNCEAENGATANRAIAALYQQAVAQGVSVFVAAGDEGAAGCDAGENGATHGIGVNAYASTPYNVAVGGTDFGDSYAGTVGKYWKTSNSASFSSAISYIPEIPWNDSCASQLVATALGYKATYGSGSLCASTQATRYNLLTVAAGSGGPSGCATGTPRFTGVVGGSCAGYARPSWQSGGLIAAGGTRGIPDLSMFAADGVWGHYYTVCYSNLSNKGAVCTGSPANWAGGGGTSFAAPVMAGIQALINQKTGSSQGNPNPVYYALAAESGKSCASNGASLLASCIFHTVVTGDIDVDCAGPKDCYGAVLVTKVGFSSGSTPNYNGALSVTDAYFAAAYGSGTGWSYATGLGSVNAYNLVMAWPTTP